MNSANEIMFQALLTDPEKRKKVLELLTSEGLVPHSENVSRASRNNTPKRRFNRIDDLSRSPLLQLLSPKRDGVKKKPLVESPSALFRKRALQKLESELSVDESSDEKLRSPPPTGTPVPFDQLLKNVVAYCEVRSKDGDRSAGIKAMMKAMGASIREEFTRDLTHVIFKDGLFSTFQKAKLLKVHLVSVLWLEAVRRHKFRVPEKKYPALGVEACDANVTAICQALQNDYDDIVQDEYRRRSEIRHQIGVSSRNNLVTYRRKTSDVPKSNTTEFNYMSGITSITESTSSRSSATTPNSSQISISSFKNKDDIVPCSQDGPSSLSNSHNENRMLMLLTDDESNENVDRSRSNIARYVKDSLELKKSLKIRSPESLASRTLSVNSSTLKKPDKNTKSLDEELSMRLHITTTDESNVNSTGNKSKSSSMNAQIEIESKDEDKDANENPKPKIKYSRRVTLGVSTSKSVINLNESSKSRISTMNTSIVNKTFESPVNLTGSKMYTKVEVIPDNKQTKKRRANKISKSNESLNTVISDLTKSNHEVIQNKNVHAEEENLNLLSNNDENRENSISNQNLEMNFDKQPVKPRFRKLYKHTYDDLTIFNAPDQATKTVKLQIEVGNLKPKTKYRVELPPNFQVPKTMSKNARKIGVKKTTLRKTIGTVKKNITSVQKLEFSSTSSDEHSQDSDEKPIRKSPGKIAVETKNNRIEDNVNIKRSPKKLILNAKVTSNESANAFKETSPNKKARKSGTTECFSDNATSSDNLQGSDADYQPNKSCVTPSTSARRSMRLNSSRIVKDNEQKETPSSAVRRSTRKTIHNIESTSMKTPAKTPNLRKKVLTNKTAKKSGSSSDETKCRSERRSTLEFVQRPSRESLERVKLTKKSKHVVKLRSIVGTRLHKGDVQVFQQTVKHLGGFIVEDEVTEKTTHLVAGAASRTINMLRAIARGCWIVRQEWLFKSLEAGKWLEEEEFELTEFAPAVQKCRLEKKSFGPLYSLDIFKECGPIYVRPSSNPRCSDLEELVDLCGGNVVKTPRLARIIVGDYFRYANIFCVNEKWILDCITQYKKISVKSYLLESRSDSGK